MGFRAGQDFARYLGWQVRQVRSDVITLPRDGETLAESLAAIGPRDCVIVFALCRPPRMLGHLIDKLAQSGGATALIGTGGARAPAGALVVIEPIHDTLDEIRATGHAGAGTTATVRIGSREAEGHPNAKLDDQEIKRADLSRDPRLACRLRIRVWRRETLRNDPAQDGSWRGIDPEHGRSAEMDGPRARLSRPGQDA